MLEENVDIWKKHDEGEWICITTNGTLNKQGYLVMGKGIALEAKKRYKDIPETLGAEVELFGNEVTYIGKYKMFFLPTKDNWRDKSDINLIKRSCLELSSLVTDMGLSKVYIPMVGCGCGGLDWKRVKEEIGGLLDNRFIVCYN
jgi:hypothetical protein